MSGSQAGKDGAGNKSRILQQIVLTGFPPMAFRQRDWRGFLSGWARSVLQAAPAGGWPGAPKGRTLGPCAGKNPDLQIRKSSHSWREAFSVLSARWWAGHAVLFVPPIGPRGNGQVFAASPRQEEHHGGRTLADLRRAGLSATPGAARWPRMRAVTRLLEPPFALCDGELFLREQLGPTLASNRAESFPAFVVYPPCDPNTAGCS